MDSVRLLNRTDTKYVISLQQLKNVLKMVNGQYEILEIKGQRYSSYKTLYFDTPKLDFYHAHQRGKLNRHKIRIRQYIGSKLTYLEIKFKNAKGRTIKNRVTIDDIETSLSKDSKTFISDISGIRSDLQAVIWNSFNRITLVNQAGPERATIDLNLTFEKDGTTLNMGNIAVVEIKQEMSNRNSPLRQALKQHHIRTMGMSKYCLGMAQMVDGIKNNNFKERIRKLNKINEYAA